MRIAHSEMDTTSEGVPHARGVHSGGAALERHSVKDVSEKIEVKSIEVDFADEALRLVGTERTRHFSEEYNLKLRRKLVNHLVFNVMNSDSGLTRGRTGTSCHSVRPCTLLSICRAIRASLTWLQLTLADRDKNSLNYARHVVFVLSSITRSQLHI